MLKEAWQWWRAECSFVAKKMGYLSEAIALDARAERQKSAWEIHLAHARAAILKSANATLQREAVLVMGSGSLHDVPIAHLSALFENVYLADIVHLSQAKHAAQHYPNVTLLEVDLTQYVSELINLPDDIDASTFLQWYQGKTLDLLWPCSFNLVVSANCLSQLPVKLVEWLQKNRPNIDEDTLNNFAWHVLRQHIAMLRAFDTPVCLITDDEQVTKDRNGNIVEHSAFIDALGLSHDVFARWTWNIAPQGELGDGCTAEHSVVAVRL